MSAAVEVIGFVMEAMRNKVSRSIGSLASTSRQPMPAAWITLPARQTSVAAPASSPALTIAPMAVEIGSSSFIFYSNGPTGPGSPSSSRRGWGSSCESILQQAALKQLLPAQRRVKCKHGQRQYGQRRYQSDAHIPSGKIERERKKGQ